MKKPARLRVFELETILTTLAKQLARYWRTQSDLQHINYTETALQEALGDSHPAIVELRRARAYHDEHI